MSVETLRKEGVKTLTIAVAGNPNSGKSTLINALAGTRLQVGNWPGVTVEKKEAWLSHEDWQLRLVDLPGTYSLSPYSQEELIARDFLIKERPDVVIDVVDATNLERNLYLTMQLLELGIPVVLALNIYDEAQAKGYQIDTKAMQEMLGAPVVPTVATKGQGLKELLEAALRAALKPQRPPSYGQDVEEALEGVLKKLSQERPELLAAYPSRWLALKLLEADGEVLRETGLTADFAHPAVEHLRQAHGEDIEAFMAELRYGLAAGLTREVLRKTRAAKTDLTERIDRIVLNRFLGIPIFLAAMWVVFKLTFDVSTPFVDWVDAATAGPLRRWTEAFLGLLGAPAWTVSLAVDGVIGGVGFVLVFVPVIFAMMFFITFLEGSGYMARAAFVMDRAMHSMGLHGKSFIPMLLGFGCNVPAIYATRTLESPRDKALTAVLVPLMSCGARLPVYVLFVGAFFPQSPGTVLWSLYVLGIAMAVLVGVVFKRTLFRGQAPLFIMELPPYRMPSMRSLLIHTWEKGKHFLLKAGTYILAVSVLVWFMLNMPWGVQSTKDSYLGKMGQALAPALKPLGFGTWEAASSLLTGIIAKEIVVGTMGEIYAAQAQESEEGPRPTFLEDLKELALGFAQAARDAGANVVSTVGIASLQAEEEGQEGLREAVRSTFSPLSAYAFMAFVLLYMPCVVVAIAMRHEFGTWKWFGLAFLYQTVLAWSVALIIYQGGRALGL
jgi:ferrous iron transport protein B